jgi:glycosyltransferase involved in cell wall biosynthesis
VAETFLFVHNNTPESWSTRQDMQLALARAVVERGHRAVLTYTQEVPTVIGDRLRSSGCEIEVFNPEARASEVRVTLHRLADKYSPSVMQTRFCSYWDRVHLVAKAIGIPRVIYIQAASGLLTSNPIKRGLLALRAKSMLAGADLIVGISEFARDQLIDLGINPDRICVITNGICCGRYRQIPPVHDRNTPVIGTASYLVDRKYLHVLIEACGILRRAGSHFRCLIAGTGPLLAQCRQKAAACGIGDRTEFPGWITNSEQFLQSCDIFAMSSLGEAFGNVVVEAMAAGRPVVAPASGAFPELITHGSDGLLYRPLDAADLAEKLHILIANRSAAIQMGRAAAFSASLYDLPYFVHQFARVYWNRFGIQIGLDADSIESFRGCNLYPRACPYLAMAR